MGALLIWGTVAAAGYIGGYSYEAGRASTRLIQEARDLVGAPSAISSGGLADTSSTAGGKSAGGGTSRQHQAPCVVPIAGPNQVGGLLEVPALGLQAPVVQGEGDPILAEAVGHDVSSAWPGYDGTAVLAAHDVSYFAHIDTLKPGDLIRYYDGCHVDTFEVTGSAVVPSGSPVRQAESPWLVLDTCYPTDALWWTPNRFLVYAQEVAVANRDGAGSREANEIVKTEVPVSVPVPSALAAEGLTLKTNFPLLGTLTVKGTPSQGFIESPMPLDVDAAAMTAYFGGMHALAQGRTDWWSKIAPRVPVPRAGYDAYTSNQYTDLTVKILAAGNRAVGVILNSTYYFSGGAEPGIYDLTVTMVVHGSELVIGKWHMVPA